MLSNLLPILVIIMFPNVSVFKLGRGCNRYSEVNIYKQQRKRHVTVFSNAKLRRTIQQVQERLDKEQCILINWIQIKVHKYQKLLWVSLMWEEQLNCLCDSDSKRYLRHVHELSITWHSSTSVQIWNCHLGPWELTGGPQPRVFDYIRRRASNSFPRIT